MDLTEICLRLGAATLIGAAIGLDREFNHKSAGVRTIALVCLGAALATLAMSTRGDIAAASRVMQGTVAGIGFLGAGVIMHHRRTIEGLTTAAAIWTSAVLGATCGLGLWQPAIVAGVLAILLLVVARLLEERLGQTKHKP